eukprot:TRINITY_DN40022_c0_g1_i1.p1 TRINITY_DN40022_c0_g1~~TRINITY_DN40022_c0_g1_i1.p1  ORF type:complete len:391 (-),score=52.50 TRINITY_DN40022_c0_g1_i1:238-1410(-)
MIFGNSRSRSLLVIASLLPFLALWLPHLWQWRAGKCSRKWAELFAAREALKANGSLEIVESYDRCNEFVVVNQQLWSVWDGSSEWDPVDQHDRNANFQTVKRAILSSLQNLGEEFPDGVVNVCMGDAARGNIIPSFAFSPPREMIDLQTVGFPNPYYLEDIFDKWQEAVDIPWAEKSNKVLFRGNMNGKRFVTSGNFTGVVRLLLARIVQQKPSFFDVGFTGHDDTYRHVVGEEAWLTQDHVFKQMHANGISFFHDGPKFKYHLNVDGVEASWRISKLLRLGGVMLLQESENQEFIVRDLKPWIHYVPVKRDLSDLLQTVQYLRENDDVGEKIAQNAHDFAMKYLNPEQTGCYIADSFRLWGNAGKPIPTSGDLLSRRFTKLGLTSTDVK